MPELARNKRATFDYDILEKFEAGIELLGFEVKAVRAGRLNLGGSYVIIRGEPSSAKAMAGKEAYLINADLPPYQPMNTPTDYDSKRTRRLLLRKDEIKKLMGRSKESNLTIVPLSVYTKGTLIKLSIGLARPKKKADKREAIKKREADREIRRVS